MSFYRSYIEGKIVEMLGFINLKLDYHKLIFFLAKGESDSREVVTTDPNYSRFNYFNSLKNHHSNQEQQFTVLEVDDDLD